MPGSELTSRGPLAWIPLRTRLTIWVLVIFAVVHMTLSLVVVLYQRRAVEAEIKSDLTSTAESVAGVEFGEIPGLVMLRVIQHARAARWGPLASIMFDENGEMLTSAGPYEKAQFEALLAIAAERVRNGPLSLFDDEGGEFLYTITPVANNRHLVVAAPRAEMHRATHPITLVLLLTLPVGLLSTGIATWYASGIALRPLQQVQSFAEELSAENVAAEIDLHNDAPEVEALRLELQSAMSRINDGYVKQARFLANVSHELKTPISVVSTEAEVLLTGKSTEEDFREFARSASEEMRRLGRMIESFLLLTRIRQGAAEVKAKRHAVNEILMEAVSACLALADQHDVSLVPTLCDTGEPTLIEGNSDLLETAIGNLIRNAIRFTGKAARVEITCAVDGVESLVSVRDFGPGVPPELIDHIFDAFTQSDQERRRGRGTGLGLQIAQGIAELHGGRIEVENRDPGCSFVLRLPLASN